MTGFSKTFQQILVRIKTMNLFILYRGLVLIIFLAMSSVFQSCSFQKDSKVEVKQNPVACVVLIDGSASYEYLDKAKVTTLNYLNHLPAKSKIYIRWITENSISDQASIISYMVPESPAKPANNLSNKAKRKYVTRMKRIKAFKQNIYRKILDAKSPQSPRTDIWGALFAASERLNGGTNMDKKLILLTDMIDNVRLEKRVADQIKFESASVEVLDYQVIPGSKENGRKEYWDKKLAAFGAVSVNFSHIDEILTFTQEDK